MNYPIVILVYGTELPDLDLYCHLGFYKLSFGDKGLYIILCFFFLCLLFDSVTVCIYVLKLSLSEEIKNIYLKNIDLAIV